jgi:hypothetical protein
MREGIPSAPSPWRFVPLADYVVPPDDRANLIKKRWKTLHRLLAGADKEADVARTEAELRALPNVRLANLVPPIDWSSASLAFAEAYRENTRAADGLAETDASSSASEDHIPHFLVCQPYCDHASIVQDWAARRRARVLQAPTSSQILSGDKAWLQTLPAGSKRPWVLPALERCFLRHANGLDLLRSFLERALSGDLGPGVIGCDSWAFAFVQRIWPLPGSPALTLQALDGPALADSFVRINRISGKQRHARFLSARSGEPLVLDEDPCTTDGTDSQLQRNKCGPELRQLAAHCRGNPGVAWHYWRKRLRAEPEHDQKDRSKDREAGTPAAGVGGQGPDDIVWVAQDIEAPSLPAEMDEDVAFVLHALLLHRGLPTDLLALLLPTPRARIASQLLRLQALGLLVREDERWQVAPLAYPTVREFLHARSYLTDAF